MNTARFVTLLALAAVVIAFAATWLTVPPDPYEDVSPPASLFLVGLGDRNACGDEPTRRTACLDLPGDNVPLSASDLSALKQRVWVVYVSAAVVVILLGVAFGATRASQRRRHPGAADGVDDYTTGDGNDEKAYEDEPDWEPDWETLPNGSLLLRKDGKPVGALELLEDGRSQVHLFEGADPSAAKHLLMKLGEASEADSKPLDGRGEPPRANP